MDNKKFGIIFSTILLTGMLFFGLANAGEAAVDKWLFPKEQFGENTYIGMRDVSNMEKESVKMLFSGQVESWRQGAELEVVYQDASALYPLDNAVILLDETVAQAETGKKNNFIFELSDATTQTFLSEQFPSAIFSSDQIESVTAKLELALENGQNRTEVAISDDTLGVEREVVSETSFTHQFQSPGVLDIVSALDGYQLEPGAQFSFLDFITELNVLEVTDAELTQIASVLYSTVLKTNFTVEERSIGTAVPAAIPLGLEAAINRNLAIDLVFTNPNDSSFALRMDLAENSLTASLTGYPFVYSYFVQNSDEQTVEPRLIRQFSAFVSSGFTVEEPGSDGMRVEVVKTIVADGEELEVQSVSTDFYPPVNRVELHPLTGTGAETSDEVIVDENGNIIQDGTNNNSGNTGGNNFGNNGNNPNNNGNNYGNNNGNNSSGGVSPGNGSTGNNNTGNSNNNNNNGNAGNTGGNNNNNGNNNGGNQGGSNQPNNGNQGNANPPSNGNSGNGSAGNGNAGTGNGNPGNGAGSGGTVMPKEPQYDKGGNLINP